MGKRDAYHHGDLRAGLVEAARALVERHGPERFTISDACRAAGVSTAAPYRHFADKDALLMAVAIEAKDRLHARITEATARHPRGSLEVLAAVGREYVAFARQEPGVFRMAFGPWKHDHARTELHDRGMDSLRALLDQIAAYQGKAAPDAAVEQCGLMLWAFVHGLAFLTIDDMTDAAPGVTDTGPLIETALRRLLAV